jgi:hypothetical protein
MVDSNVFDEIAVDDDIVTKILATFMKDSLALVATCSGTNWPPSLTRSRDTGLC